MKISENAIDSMFVGEKKKTISEYVEYTRKLSHLSVYKFASNYKISSSLVKKYESGEYDENPSPLIASNFCKNFNITPKEFVEQFDLSKVPNFNFDAYLDSLTSYYNSSPFSFDSIESIKSLLNLKTKDNIPQISRGFHGGFNPHISVIFEDENGLLIAGRFLKYQKVHAKQSILDAYKDEVNSVLYASLFHYQNHLAFGDSDRFIHNFIFATQSKNLFHALYEVCNREMSKIEKGSNVIILLLPKNNSTNYSYFCFSGNDFINKNENYYIYLGPVKLIDPNE